VDRPLWDYVTSETLAQEYDHSLMNSSLFSLDLAFVHHWLPATPGTLLDLGCGTGRLLAALPPSWRGVGVDLSLPMLQQTRAKLPTVDLVQGNLTQLEFFAPGCFDVAACLFSTLGMIHPAEQRRRFVAGVHRLLAPGGRFLLHVHNRWFHLWTPAGRSWLLGATRDYVMPPHQGIAGLRLHQFTRREVLALLRQVGFRIREVRPLSLAADGRLPLPWLLPALRAYGYLIAAER
jgi:SAM-dependent methyltransferase